MECVPNFRSQSFFVWSWGVTQTQEYTYRFTSEKKKHLEINCPYRKRFLLYFVPHEKFAVVLEYLLPYLKVIILSDDNIYEQVIFIRCFIHRHTSQTDAGWDLRIKGVSTYKKINCMIYFHFMKNIFVSACNHLD